MDPAPPFAIEPISGEFGAALVRVGDLAQTLAAPDAPDALREALAHHHVLCLRIGRKLDAPDFVAVTELFGAIKDPVARTPGGESIRYDATRQVIDAGFVDPGGARGLELGALDAERPGLFVTFHIDDTYTEAPAAATVLHARALPPSGGGDTVFLDLQTAYERLPNAERARLRGLRVVHAHNNRGAFPDRVSARGPADALAPVAHPLVRAHPTTGRPCLFFDLDRATHVEGMAEAEGRALLRGLQDHVEVHAPRHVHVWAPFDVLVWDNAAVQHCARGDYPLGEPRRFWRHLVEGQKPRAHTDSR